MQTVFELRICYASKYNMKILIYIKFWNQNRKLLHQKNGGVCLLRCTGVVRWSFSMSLFSVSFITNIWSICLCLCLSSSILTLLYTHLQTKIPFVFPFFCPEFVSVQSFIVIFNYWYYSFIVKYISLICFLLSLFNVHGVVLLFLLNFENIYFPTSR